MKTIFLLLGLCIALSSCEKQGDLTTDTPTIATAVTPTSVLKDQGVFMPTSGITVAGGVTIYSDMNQYKLSLDNFSVSDGPDLKVYLSKSSTPTEFVNLGNLNQATVYSIPQ